MRAPIPPNGGIPLTQVSATCSVRRLSRRSGAGAPRSARCDTPLSRLPRRSALSSRSDARIGPPRRSRIRFIPFRPRLVAGRGQGTSLPVHTTSRGHLSQGDTPTRPIIGSPPSGTARITIFRRTVVLPLGLRFLTRGVTETSRGGYESLLTGVAALPEAIRNRPRPSLGGRASEKGSYVA